MYSQFVQTAILLTLLWFVLILWSVSLALRRLTRLIRHPAYAVKVTRKDFDASLTKYVVVSVAIRYFLRKWK